ncbi:serine hydrolase domain-containing protein [Microbacterium sp.]|uniref:serine hydrolase domain-containing protein n=1 Tax=Microbacterium sp. TaxID=51671 RepID=UPI0039E2F272
MTESALVDVDIAGVHGKATPRFIPVVEAFADSTVGRPGGGALAIRVDGAPVVDVWGGSADTGGEQSWDRDTATVVFSCTKGVVSLLVARLIQEGRIALDGRVADYWPEFAQAGKSDITVRDLLAHRGGLAALRQDIDLDTALDGERMSALLAEAEPLWEPGTQWGYHALTFGWLAGELVRRVTGLSVDAYLRQLVREPLGADFWIGVPEQARSRVARLVPDPHPLPVPADPTVTAEDMRWMERTMTLGGAFPAQLVGDRVGFDDPRVQAAQIPGAGGVGTARALASLWSATVVSTDGVRLLDDDVTSEMSAVRSEGQPVWGGAGPFPRWGAGFMRTSEVREFLTDRSFGHDGAGGQVAFADPEHRVGFGYVTNLIRGGGDERGTSIVRALRSALSQNNL